MNIESEIEPHNEPVLCEALCLLSWDGDPTTEGAEYYAPQGYVPEQETDAEGRALTGLPSTFTTTRIQAEALVKAGAVRIVG